MLCSPAAECTSSPTNALDAGSDPVFVCKSHKGSGVRHTQSKWCKLHKHPSATDATQKLRRPFRGQCTALILCQLTQTCFRGGPAFATWTFQGSSGSLSSGGGEVWKLLPLATAVCTWSSNSITMKPPMRTAPNKLSGSFWSPPAFAYVYLMRAHLLRVVVCTIVTEYGNLQHICTWLRLKA
jgi:hypothetical protein